MQYIAKHQDAEEVSRILEEMKTAGPGAVIPVSRPDIIQTMATMTPLPDASDWGMEEEGE